MDGRFSVETECALNEGHTMAKNDGNMKFFH